MMTTHGRGHDTRKIWSPTLLSSIFTERMSLQAGKVCLIDYLMEEENNKVIDKIEEGVFI